MSIVMMFNACVLISALLIHTAISLRYSTCFLVPAASRSNLHHQTSSVYYERYRYTGSAHVRNGFHLYSGYIPPELDPEYRNIAVRSASIAPSKITASAGNGTTDGTDDFASLPLPKEGDIVQYKGRWGDKQIGRIRFMRYIESYQSFFADIVPLAEGKADKVFVVDRASNAEYLSTDELQPVKAYFMRNENGYKLYYSKADPKEVVLRAPRYRKVDQSYTPRSKVCMHCIIDDDDDDGDDDVLLA